MSDEIETPEAATEEAAEETSRPARKKASRKKAVSARPAEPAGPDTEEMRALLRESLPHVNRVRLRERISRCLDA